MTYFCYCLLADKTIPGEEKYAIKQNTMKLKLKLICGAGHE